VRRIERLPLLDNYVQTRSCHGVQRFGGHATIRNVSRSYRCIASGGKFSFFFLNVGDFGQRFLIPNRRIVCNEPNSETAMGSARRGRFRPFLALLLLTPIVLQCVLFTLGADAFRQHRSTRKNSELSSGDQLFPQGATGSRAGRPTMLIAALLDGTVRALDVPSGQTLWHINTDPVALDGGYNTRAKSDDQLGHSPTSGLTRREAAASTQQRQRSGKGTDGPPANTLNRDQSVPSPEPYHGDARVAEVNRPLPSQPAPAPAVPYGIPIQRRETRAFTVRLRDGELLRRISFEDDEASRRCKWDDATSAGGGATGIGSRPDQRHSEQPLEKENAEPVLVITRTDSGMRFVDPLTGEASWNVTYADYEMYLLDEPAHYAGEFLAPFLFGRRVLAGESRCPARHMVSSDTLEESPLDPEDPQVPRAARPVQNKARYVAILADNGRFVVVRDADRGTTMWSAEFPYPILSLRAIGDIVLITDTAASSPVALPDGGTSDAVRATRHFWQWSRPVPLQSPDPPTTLRYRDEWQQMCLPPSAELYRKPRGMPQNAYSSFGTSVYDHAPVHGGVLLVVAIFFAGIGPLALALALWTIWRMRRTEREQRHSSERHRTPSPPPVLRRRETKRVMMMTGATQPRAARAQENDRSRGFERSSLVPKPVPMQRVERPRSVTDSATGSEAPLPTGYQKVGRLLISPNVIGYGSHGTSVYEGLLLPGYRRVAVKRLLKSFYQIARREIEVLIELDESCQHILRYYAMEESGDFIYVALELCAGSLQDRVERGELPATRCPLLDELSTEVDRRAAGPLQLGPPPATVRALRGLLLGIAELHDHGIVHRDLKPANVLLAIGSDDIVKIADVGLAKRLDAGRGSFTAGATAVGSVGWRPPEVLRGASLFEGLNSVHSETSAVDDARERAGDATACESMTLSENGGADAARPARLTRAVDIFSVGCITFYVLTMGSHPFGELVFQRDANILAGAADLSALRAWPEAFDLVRLAIQHEPERRPSAKALLGHPFFWSDARKLQFLIDVSDALFEHPDSRNLRQEIERGCESTVLGPLGNWSLRMDTSVLLSLRGRSYNGSSIVDLLRLARNKRTHYHQQPDAVKALLGPVPVEDDPMEVRSRDNAVNTSTLETTRAKASTNSNLYTYFASRFPNLFMHVYAFAIRTGLALSEHFQRYPSRELIQYYEHDESVLSLTTNTSTGPGESSTSAMPDSSSSSSSAEADVHTTASVVADERVPSTQTTLPSSRPMPGRRVYSRALFDRVRQEISENPGLSEELDASLLQLSGPHPLRRRSCEFFLASTVVNKPERDHGAEVDQALMRLPSLLAPVSSASWQSLAS